VGRNGLSTHELFREGDRFTNTPAALLCVAERTSDSVADTTRTPGERKWGLRRWARSTEHYSETFWDYRWTLPTRAC
jgi:hypothetical protein